MDAGCILWRPERRCRRSRASTMIARTRKFLDRLGPGLITGAADDDPSGIATYSQAGAQFGLGMLWSVLLTTPLMVGIQIVSARIGRVSGHGLAAQPPRPLPAAAAVVHRVAAARREHASTSRPTSARWARRCASSSAARRSCTSCCSACWCVALQLFLPYSRLAPVLKWLTLALFAYVAVVFTVQIPWRDAVRRHDRAARRAHARLPACCWSACSAPRSARICSSGRRRRKSRSSA